MCSSISLPLLNSTLSTFISVVPTRISVNVELKLNSLFLLKCGHWSPPSWTSFCFYTGLWVWYAERDAEIFSPMGGFTENTLPGDPGNFTSSFHVSLWKAVSLLNAAPCSAPEPSLFHIQPYFFLALFYVLFHCFCPNRVPKMLSFP